ncbi:glycine/sarcosine/betaine reductase complex component C subunit alpha [Facklamia sp. P12932]|uniref:glycine/sarcosine/betaine reductase complex component C subunit alpha n=1 Tax=Facklamia sp. P12932 TaxID=3421947 RepID=UPI003D1705C8
MSNQVNQAIKDVINELAHTLESGQVGPSIKIGLTINGSELGFDVMREAAALAKSEGLFEVVLIGEKLDWTEEYEHYEANDESAVEETLEKLLNDGTIHGAVTLHHTFPIGVSTVGRVISPALGREMFIATTTGTTATVRTEAMVLNAINGIAVAKAKGIQNPTVGIVNVDGANTVERALRQLQEKGYDITFGESARSDGGVVLRGNDLLLGSADVMVCDSLTGNILMKLFGSYTSGGTYETTGFGYGPGVGDGYDHIINIVSRASGAPVIANALKYAFQMAKGKLTTVAKQEYESAKKAGLKDVREGLQPKATVVEEEIKAPAKEVVTAQINGIDVLDLEDAVKALWKEGIYAESGMGCSGPIVMISGANAKKANEIVKEKGYM